jgi:hypothetical protein
MYLNLCNFITGFWIIVRRELAMWQLLIEIVESWLSLF